MIFPRAESPIGPAEARVARRPSLATLFALLLLSTTAIHADSATIVDATADCRNDVCRFEVTIGHDDSGWDHYADRWRVLDPDGNVLGTRMLVHPHVDEQPFTRSLAGVHIPPGVSRVTIEARDSVHGISEHTFSLVLDP